jgi:hypothetical protein
MCRCIVSGLHEDLERLERLIVKDYKQDVKGHKDKLMQQHRVRKRLDQLQETSRKLVRALSSMAQHPLTGTAPDGHGTCPWASMAL